VVLKEEKSVPLSASVVSVVAFVWGIFGIVGHGEVRSDACGKVRRLMGCLGHDGKHDKVDAYGHNFHNKVALMKVFMSCYSPRCPKCVKAWASREADIILGRLLALSKRFGLVEHGTVSFPVGVADVILRMSRKEFNAFRREVEAKLVGLGVIGGLLVFHPARYKRGVGWYWSPHFHFLGCLVPSYGRCRRCQDKVCRGRTGEYGRCDGFDARVRQLNAGNGWIVRVFGQRKKEWKSFVMDGEVVRVSSDVDNIRGTLTYELGHAGLIVDIKRADVVHWFGVAHGLKFTRERRKLLCPICDDEFVQVRALSPEYEDCVCGRRVHVVDGFNVDGSARYIEMFASLER
jgi:hypothetical protein